MKSMVKNKIEYLNAVWRTKQQMLSYDLIFIHLEILQFSCTFVALSNWLSYESELYRGDTHGCRF